MQSSSPRSLIARARRRLAAEDGVGLIEVMVSAVLIIVISIAVLGGIDNASGISGQNRSKSMATNLAQQDQERLRTLKARQLSNLRQTSTRRVANLDYTVRSQVDWVSDATGATSCTSGGGSTDYLKISSEVTWVGAKRPVRIDSIMAPPNGSFGPTEGSVAVEVLGRSDVGVPGVEVDIVGPPSYDKDTNEVGCAFFGFLPSANQFSAVIDQAGFVDPDGNQRIERQVTVQPEAITAVGVKYDRAGAINARFTTKPAGQPAQAAPAASVIFSNGGLTAQQRLVDIDPAASAHSEGRLFPFLQPYTVYAGNCAGADPGSFRDTQSVVLEPGASEDLEIRLPAMNVQVRRGAAPAGGAAVRIISRDPNCESATRTTDARGVLIDPGMPYGDYDVCVAEGGNRWLFPNVSNRNPDGSPVVDVDLNSAVNKAAGACP